MSLLPIKEQKCNRNKQGGTMLPSINTPIEIYDAEADKTYKSIISDITHDQVLIATPMDNRKLIYYEPGATLEIIYSAEGANYGFTATILGRQRAVILQYIVRKPTEKDIRRIQRRQYFRIEASLKMECELGIFTTLDVSGGGLRCSSPRDMDIVADQKIAGILHLPKPDGTKLEPIPFQGQVLRIFPSDLGKNQNFAMAFTVIEEKYREKIIQYCIRLQLQNRK